MTASAALIIDMEESVDSNEKRADLLELSILFLVSVAASPLAIEVGVGGTRVATGNGLDGIGDFLPACFLRFFKLGNLLNLADRLFPLLPLSGVTRGGSAGKTRAEEPELPLARSLGRMKACAQPSLEHRRPEGGAVGACAQRAAAPARQGARAKQSLGRNEGARD